MPKSRPLNRKLSVKLSDIMVLMYHLHMANDRAGIGFEDADYTIEEIMVELEKAAPLLKDVLERALWSCNLMDEAGYFWHPDGITFDSFIRRLLKGRARFDKRYNLILPNEEIEDVK